MDIPTCCGEPMFVVPGGFECDICAETMTIDEYDNKCESAWLREQESLRNNPPESYESIQAKARALK